MESYTPNKVSHREVIVEYGVASLPKSAALAAGSMVVLDSGDQEELAVLIDGRVFAYGRLATRGDRLGVVITRLVRPVAHRLAAARA